MAGYLQQTEQSGESTIRTKAVTVPSLFAMRERGEKITMLTAYDASFASLMDMCGVETILIGDSLGMVCQGHNSTLPVTIDEVAYHTACVARGNKTALVLADLPFGTYATKEDAFRNAVKLVQAGAQMVKIEGGAWVSRPCAFWSNVKFRCAPIWA
jgi:3-methyl-2-oxobutanoate hydroxymethyltransferase